MWPAKRPVPECILLNHHSVNESCICYALKGLTVGAASRYDALRC
jgi:hypothetical protein